MVRGEQEMRNTSTTFLRPIAETNASSSSRASLSSSATDRPPTTTTTTTHGPLRKNVLLQHTLQQSSLNSGGGGVILHPNVRHYHHNNNNNNNNEEEEDWRSIDSSTGAAYRMAVTTTPAAAITTTAIPPSSAGQMSVVSDVAADIYDCDDDTNPSHNSHAGGGGGGDTTEDESPTSQPPQQRTKKKKKKKKATTDSSFAAVTSIFWTRRNIHIVLWSILLLVGVVVAIVVVVAVNSNHNSNRNNNSKNTNGTTSNPNGTIVLGGDGTNTPAENHLQSISNVLMETTLDTDNNNNDPTSSVWEDPTSSQVLARDWILQVDTLRDTIVAADGGWNRLKQRYALVQLYYATNGLHWSSSTSSSILDPTEDAATTTLPIDFLNPYLSECNWTGVTCDENPAARRLQDPSTLRRRPRTNGTHRTLSDASVDSTNGPSHTNHKVFRLYFRNMNLTGTIPNELGRCIPQLRELDLSNNTIYGTIPSALFAPDGHWDETLYWLDISNNQLSGSIPSTIWTLQELRFLFLNHNQLSGKLERYEVGSQTTILSDTNGNNDTTSTTTTTTGEKRANLLQQVQLHVNQLSGSIPTWIGELLDLEQWIVYDNRLTGPLPDPLPIAIVEFDVSYNNITGTIPTSFWSKSTSPSKLKRLYMDHNLLTGPLPNSTQLRQDMSLLWLHDNLLNGSIPEKFGYVWNRLSKLQLHHNNLQGILGPNVSSTELVDGMCPSNNTAVWPELTLMTADCLQRLVTDPPPVQCDCCTMCEASISGTNIRRY
jgi:hypothetical protein